jgi:hypothetical protein
MVAVLHVAECAHFVDKQTLAAVNAAIEGLALLKFQSGSF